MRSARQTAEMYAGDGSTVGGVPGVPSNVPDEAAPSYPTTPNGQTASNGYQRTDVITNYEVSRAVSHIISATGTVERLSVSILRQRYHRPGQDRHHPTGSGRCSGY